jgi:hypothetical protein
VGPREWANDRVALLTLALLVLVTGAAWAGVLVQAASMPMGGAPMGAEVAAGLVTFLCAEGLFGVLMRTGDKETNRGVRGGGLSARRGEGSSGPGRGRAHRSPGSVTGSVQCGSPAARRAR